MYKLIQNRKIYAIFKRIIDIVLSLILIVLLSPVMMIIFLLLKIQGDGVAIFRQERIGRDGKIFEILKFRSMKTAAPSLAAKDIEGKDFITPLGGILRKTSLDELPQLINILKGEMSFVGPRPLIPNEGWINEKRRIMGIHTLRPGLTGWAQVKARDTEDQEEKLKLDLYYKFNKTLILDFKILLMTAFTIVHKK